MPDIDPQEIAPILNAGNLREVEPGRQWLGTVEIFGVPHHLFLLRVRYSADTNEQQAYDPEDENLFDDISRLFDGCFRTIALPGQAGEWIACMHPYD